ncbi:MAG: RNA methyltransferase [Thermomicrobiales bacterium]
MSVNSSVISLRECRRLHSRKERQATGRFLVEGIRPVRAALMSHARIEVVLYVPESLRDGYGRDTIDLARSHHIPCQPLTPAQFSSISTRDNPRRIAAVGRQAWSDLEQLASATAPIVVLHEPQDPGNLGTILRTCDAAGAAGVVLTGDAVDPWHPTALRAAMGATFGILLVRCDVSAFVAWARSLAIPIIGTSDRATTDYATHEYDDRFVLLMGSERQGLPGSLEAIAGNMVRIPMAGQADSLNLAVATSLVLYEARNQRMRRRATRACGN